MLRPFFRIPLFNPFNQKHLSRKRHVKQSCFVLYSFTGRATWTAASQMPHHITVLGSPWTSRQDSHGSALVFIGLHGLGNTPNTPGAFCLLDMRIRTEYQARSFSTHCPASPGAKSCTGCPFDLVSPALYMAFTCPLHLGLPDTLPAPPPPPPPAHGLTAGRGWGGILYAIST